MFKKVTQQNINKQEYLNKLSMTPGYMDLKLTNVK